MASGAVGGSRARETGIGGRRAWALVGAGVALWVNTSLMFTVPAAMEPARFPDAPHLAWLAALLGNVLSLGAMAAASRRVPRGFAASPAWVAASGALEAGGALALAASGASQLALWAAVLLSGMGEGMALVLLAEVLAGLPCARILLAAGLQQAVAAAISAPLLALPAEAGLAVAAGMAAVQTALLAYAGRRPLGEGGRSADGALAVWPTVRGALRMLVMAALVVGLAYGSVLALTLGGQGFAPPAANMAGTMAGGLLLMASSLAFARRDIDEYLFKVAVPLLALGVAAVPLLVGGIPLALPLLLACSAYMFGLLWFFVSIASASSGAPAGRLAALVFLGFFLGHATGRSAVALAPAPLGAPGVVSTVLLLCVVLALVLYILSRRRYEQRIVARAEELSFEAACEAAARQYGLTPREAEVFRLLALGLSTRKIADKLVLSQNSVNTHIRHIYGKAGIHGRGEVPELLRRLERR